jgi:lipopolysaccharide/colanic/teichoic acid biosynthesis glycosyltransferase
MQYGFAAVSLVLLAPLCLIIGLVSKFTSPGPILHRGLRVGKDGRIFTIYNFRTLQVGAAEKIGARPLTDRHTKFPDGQTCRACMLIRCDMPLEVAPQRAMRP